MDFRRDLLDTAKRCCEATGKARSTIATLVMNDGKFFDRIEAGGGFRVDTYAKVKQQLDEMIAAAPKPEAA